MKPKKDGRNQQEHTKNNNKKTKKKEDDDDFIINTTTKIKGCNNIIDEISEATRTVCEINDQSIKSINESEEKKLAVKLQRLVEVTDLKIKQTEETIFHTPNNTVENTKATTSSLIEFRRRFDEEKQKYQQAQENYHTGMNMKVKRQIRMIKPDASEEEIENIINSSGNFGREELIRKMILMGGVVPNNNNNKNNTTDSDDEKKEEIAVESSESSTTPMYSCVTDFDWCSMNFCVGSDSRPPYD